MYDTDINLHTLPVVTTDVGVEAMFYDVFYRQRGIRRINNFQIPKFSDLNTFELPRESVVHYLGDGNVELGPAPTDLFLRKAVGLILADNVSKLESTEGSPIRTPITSERLVNDYKAQYRRIRPMKNLSTGLRDERTIVVVNYCMLSRLYRYRLTVQTRLFKFQNTMRTFVARVNELARQTPRQQWLQIYLPTQVPTKGQFVLGTQQLNRQTMTYFPDDHSLLLLELWKWFGPRRHLSLLSKLTPEAVAKLNLVVVEQGKYTVVNLGVIDAARADPEDPKSSGFAPAQIQLHFVKFLDSVFTIRSVAAKTTIESTLPEEDDPNADLIAGNTSVELKPESVNQSPELITATTDEEPDTTQIVSIANDGEELEQLRQLEAEAEELNRSLAAEDTQMQFVPTVEPTMEYEPPTDEGPHDINSGVVAAADTLIELGLISTAEHRRYSRLADTYTTMPNPVGEGTVGDLLRVDPTLMNNLEEVTIPDMSTVLDKTMLKSTLIDFDPVYIEKALPTAIANMVFSAQKSGIAVTGYNVTPYVDANNKFDLHEVKFTPVGGAPSTFHFRLPRVNKAGVWEANGVKYRMRKQHGD